MSDPVMIAPGFVLYPGVREGFLVGCLRCKGMTFFPWLSGAPDRVPAFLETHPLWCPAVIEEFLSSLH